MIFSYYASPASTSSGTSSLLSVDRSKFLKLSDRKVWNDSQIHSQKTQGVKVIN
ncbi:predicted protein [Sclerotinia sclerotiorum 1980 UF-70]|uniref:Uncharacterized protein n=1 Tax=Sclerotinia sclerotiorum (strain ATCC 18683 / 1980 / Ss-1) TaxID=665079 RepID=A7F2C2_SCLS1|nr:predicted protein [Sclerotinia sclerotiorum 1980 UF-70]EDN95864.1 predicted protein [Sclerotinia sclerotiorum 1980 UF-70]